MELTLYFATESKYRHIFFNIQYNEMIEVVRFTYLIFQIRLFQPQNI